MKRIFILFFISSSVLSFSQKSTIGYNLLDFYKDNWGHDEKTGWYYEKHDLDSFSNTNKAFKKVDTCINGLSITEIKKIFGEPHRISSYTNVRKIITYMYLGGEYDYSKRQPSFGWLQIDFDGDTKKVIHFERSTALKPQE